MFLTIKNAFNCSIKSTVVTCFYLLFTSHASAALTDLGDAPLVTTTTGDQVLPNLMYILDNSGSMSWDFMPDYVGYNAVTGPRTVYDNKCKDTINPSGFSAFCRYGDPAHNSNFFNSIYYNPEITYLPPKNANGSDRISMTFANTAGWTSVPRDAFGVQSGSFDSLIPTSSTTGFPDVVWCNTNAPANLSDPTVCRKNTQYIYPNNTGSPATSFNNRLPVRGYPFYYTVSAGEYCTDVNLTNCIATKTPTEAQLAVYPTPASLRWCKDAASVLSGLGCQGKYNEDTKHTFARWSGIESGNTGATRGRIKINADTAGCGVLGTPSCAAPSPMRITDITVNGNSIIAPPGTALSITDTTLQTQRSSLATAIANAINSFVSAPLDFTATAAADEVTIFPVSGTPTGTIELTFATPSPSRPAVAGNRAVGSFRITRSRDGVIVRGVRVDTPSGRVEIMNQGGNPASINLGDSANTRRALANLIVSRINAFASNPDYDAVSNNADTPTITITAKGTTSASNGALTFDTTGTTGTVNFSNVVGLAGGGVNGVSSKTYTIPVSISEFTGNTPVVTTFKRVDITPSTVDYPKAENRTDCGQGSFCSYDQEMTNFANWYSYYRTRMQMMKTSTSRAFAQIDTRYRVGLMTIARPINQTYPRYLPIAQYTQAQKNDWYAMLFSTAPNNPVGTPLREALTIAGRIYAGKGATAIGNGSDPVQYSCQQNFSLLTTDGYWNGNGGKDINGGDIGDEDGEPTPRPQLDTTKTGNTLADAAKYYYKTDLRQGDPGSAACTGAPRGTNNTTGDVCQNNVFVTDTDNNPQQHMTTFTLGLGVDATLTYDKDYKVATKGDYYELGEPGRKGTKDWPQVTVESQTSVDDLWHAAVNGQGTYFSAKDPNQLTSSLNEALNGIKAKVGAGAAAATSTLNPVATDNSTYVASYTSVKWTGNLESRAINTVTGKVSQDATWCVEDVVADICATTPVKTDSNNSTIYECVTPNATADSCNSPGATLDENNNCRVEVSTSCSGELKKLVPDTGDTRNIFMNVNGSLVPFTSANIAAAGKGNNFSNTFLAGNLSQFTFADFSAEQRALVNSDSLVNYLRGNKLYEDRSGNNDGSVNTRLYRVRDSVLGDLVDSTPVFVGSPKANLSDPGYGPATAPSSFKAIRATRAGTIFIGANDGMLHAIDAATGQERWAYMPTMVLDNLWKLADIEYGDSVKKPDHAYYVNGDIVVNDVCTGGCDSASTAQWRTILVAGLNAGGKGYFALDITEPAVDNVTTPTTPKLLWEFDENDDENIGFSFGNPIITKKPDGTWVVLVTSGYNNINSTSNSGKGFLYVLNAGTGNVIGKYGTNEGTNDSPSGLAEINAYIDDAEVNNQTRFVYGGDLLGNVWRFDLSAASGTAPFKVAILKDPSGKTQPITTRPELAEVNGKPVLYVGTGRYLGKSDLDDTQQQSIYAIVDDTSASPTTLDNPRLNSLMVQQVLEASTTTATRTIKSPAKPVNLTTGRGWFIDFLDPKERQNIPAQLVFGTLLLPTTVPLNTDCSTGGYGWLNFLDYKTGATIAGNVVSSKTNAPIVGMNVVYINGKPVVSIVTADNPTPTFPPDQPSFSEGSASQFTNHRVIWRELIPDEQ